MDLSPGHERQRDLAVMHIMFDQHRQTGLIPHFARGVRCHRVTASASAGGSVMQARARLGLAGTAPSQPLRRRYVAGAGQVYGIAMGG